MAHSHQENKPSRSRSGFSPIFTKAQELLNFLAIRCFLVPAIRIYQYAISPLLGPHCRFTPTCSQYALEALQVHGFWRGMGLTIRRVSRCHPWGKGGEDPVPNATSCCDSAVNTNKHPTK